MNNLQQLRSHKIILSRKEALTEGFTHYFTGRSCKHGHISPRRSTSRGCVECYNLAGAKWIANNRKQHHLIVKNWHKNNRLRWNAYARKWAKANPQFYAFHAAKRRATKLQATPKWLTKHQLEAIKQIYFACPNGMHVDHIIPLKGENVCGLHVPWNLQYLTPTENSKKKNHLTSLL